MMKVHEVHSVSEFNKRLEAFCKPVKHFLDDSLYLFRGQGADRSLIPGIARLNLGKTGLSEAEDQMLQAFKTWGRSLLDVAPENDWDWLAVGQHHGLPTRLLDWSFNALAALWFAVREPYHAERWDQRDPNERRAHDREGRGVVWMFKPRKSLAMSDEERAGPTKIAALRIFSPSHITRRIVSQLGCFTAHPFPDEGEPFSGLEADPKYHDRLTKLTIPADRFPSIRGQLLRLGVSPLTIFPDLDGVCEHIRWIHSYLDDEKILS